jgi:hypothetical protein
VFCAPDVKMRRTKSYGHLTNTRMSCYSETVSRVTLSAFITPHVIMVNSKSQVVFRVFFVYVSSGWVARSACQTGYIPIVESPLSPWGEGEGEGVCEFISCFCITRYRRPRSHPLPAPPPPPTTRLSRLLDPMMCMLLRNNTNRKQRLRH